jgi:hypothetical protein
MRVLDKVRAPNRICCIGAMVEPSKVKYDRYSLYLKKNCYHMEKEKVDGYIAGLVFLLVGIIIVVVTAPTLSLSNTGSLVGPVIGIFFGGLGAGSLWKPDTLGPVVAEMAHRLSQNATRDEVPKGKKQEIHVTQKIEKVEGDVITQIATNDTVAKTGDKIVKRKRKSS